MAIQQGLVGTYLQKLREAVAGGEFTAAAQAQGVAAAWAPLPPRYVDGTEAVCVPAQSIETRCATANWDPSLVDPASWP